MPEVPRKLRFPDYMAMAQDGGKFVSLTHRPLLPPGNTPGTHFCWKLCRPQGHSAIGRIMSMKNSNDTSRIEPATFRFVAQHLNHCATAVPHTLCMTDYIIHENSVVVWFLAVLFYGWIHSFPRKFLLFLQD
jgi:hypothetical protein